ncbi:probable methyltransferase PMT9 isoform X2 [Amborella trichopoda]|uniref:probable methyltransferase PMT9 isoform X2 n=1 Tax=Amborella trichopoda TaxID=13333 RepID=UPI0005D369A5|nr:probable methyltransferase PMT9 isoform X2 [Amborella trichopoda]|eukprot:XP_011626481.1 probable methyltransferase PMT9 isoform X2 [Amborella trichopoda]
MKYRGDYVQSKRVVASSILAALVFVGLICVYYGSFFAPQFREKEDFDGVDPVIGRVRAGEDDSGEGVRVIDAPSKDEESGFDSSDFDGLLPDQQSSETYRTIPVCVARLSELIPCLDRNLHYQLKLKLNLSLMEHYERHCPPQVRRYNCLIPPPPGYKPLIRWPASRDAVWKANIPHTHLATEKSDQNWMVVNGDKINFPGGGTHFHYGADKYITSLAKMLKFPDDNLNNGGNIRNVLDVGCGVASFGAYLLPLNIIAMSLAPNDVHENQIQFALERGIPSALGVLGTMRLPYPSRSFELVHCSRCRIDWLQRDGILLLELDRLLRPGGYFAYSSPEAYSQDEENLKIWNDMNDLLKRMCWKVRSKRDQTVIWVKPMRNSCYFARAQGTQPPLCTSDDDPDAAWYVPMKACITVYSKNMHRAKGSGLVPWPQRLSTPPPRLQELNISNEEYLEDMEIWRWRVTQYWKQMKAEVQRDTFRNVMDLKANLGGFAAALNDKDVWVMNVIPVNESTKLKIIYDRGLIGTVHDC